MANERDLERLYRAAVALADLASLFVFTGGSVTSIFVTDPAAPPTRFSDDVDVIVCTHRRADYYSLEHSLRGLGFVQRPDQLICRWFRDDLILDVMPDNADVLGFGNRWYADAHANADELQIRDLKVRVISPVYFLATKLEAFKGRGKGDYQQSRDIEDLVAVVDGRTEVIDEVAAAADDVRAYLAHEIGALVGANAFLAALAGHLAGDDARAEIVLERLAALAAL